MQFNIVTGYWEPEVPKLHQQYLLVIQCRIEALARLERYFFTDGQANAALTAHYNDLQYLGEIDWESIQHGNFSKGGEDYDRSRRYQAEFLVHHHVPVEFINALIVYNEKLLLLLMKSWQRPKTTSYGLPLGLSCFFDQIRYVTFYHRRFTAI